MSLSVKNEPSGALICITGGIGSGKSVVCRLLRAMGYHVYDCDSRAKHLMSHNQSLLTQLAEAFPSAVKPNDSDSKFEIDRKELASLVFGNPERLRLLNSLVHTEVLADIMRWTERHNQDRQPLFIESAIAYSSGLYRIVNEMWRVEAPMELRISRACRRDGCHASHIESRISSQVADEPSSVPADAPYPAECKIINDGSEPLIPQIMRFLRQTR